VVGPPGLSCTPLSIDKFGAEDDPTKPDEPFPAVASEASTSHPEFELFRNRSAYRHSAIFRPADSSKRLITFKEYNSFDCVASASVLQAGKAGFF